jgi:hypothetical protein
LLSVQFSPNTTATAWYRLGVSAQKYGSKVRHCFQCGDEVEAKGVQGIMDAYRGVFNTPLTMSYPTDFTELIRTAASYAQHQQVSTTGDMTDSVSILILTSGFRRWLMKVVICHIPFSSS